MNDFDYAFLDSNNKVIDVFSFDTHDESLLEQVKNTFGYARYISCEEFGPAHKDGDFYNNKFYYPKPYSSWVRDEEKGEWKAPVEYPVVDEENPKYYEWNEETLNWEEIQVSE